MLKNIKIIDAMNSIFFFKSVLTWIIYFSSYRLHVLHPSKNKYKNSLLKVNLKVCFIFVHDISLFWISDIA